MKERYLCVPVSLLQNLIIKPNEVLNNIIDYGVYYFSQTQDLKKTDPNFNLEEYLVKQFLYVYYRKTETIPINLLNKFEKYVEIGDILLDEDYNGFHGAEFNPELEIENIFEIFGKDEDFKKELFDFAKSIATYSYLGITGNIENTIKRAKKIEKEIPDHSPMVMIKKDKVFEFRDENKTEFELMTFAVYLGIRSILGKKSYCKTTKDLILARAFGFRNKTELEKNKPELYLKYSKRYQIDKLLNAVESEWNIHLYSSNKMRGIYVSNKNKISLEKLITIAEEKNKKNKIEQLKNKKKQIAENVRLKMNFRQPTQQPNDKITAP